MNNLFKRSVVSLALVGAITSSLFGGKAAYIDVRVNYLSGTGKATIGHESWNDANSKFNAGAKKDLVELYIRVLDADGNFADKDKDNENLRDMVISRSGLSVQNFGTGSGSTGSTPSNAIQRGVIATSGDSGKAIANKNAARYTLDYTKQNVGLLIDELHIKAGELGKNIKINLVAGDAKGLIVRATNKDQISATGGYLNALFTNINVSGDENLSAQSENVQQITAGEKIPLRVYASTASKDYANGRFTSSDDSLNDKTIVVVAVGDYDMNDSTGKTTTYLGHTEFTMNKGIASGEMVINSGLPDKNSSGAATGNNSFSASTFVGGLGVAFIAYVKDKSTISNNGNVLLSGGVLRTDKNNLVIVGNDADTDAIKVKSGKIVGFKAGSLTTSSDKTPLMATNYFTDQSNVFVANNRDLPDSVINDMEQNITIIAVDSLGNPGTAVSPILVSDSNASKRPSKIKIGSEDFSTGTNASIRTFSVQNGDVNISDTTDGVAASAAPTLMLTNSITGITSGGISIKDGTNKLAARKTVQVFYRTANGFSSTSAATFTVTTLDVIGETPKDVKGDLRSFMDLNITNRRGILFTEHKKETDNADMKLYISVVAVDKLDDDAAKDADKNVTLAFKVLDSEGAIDKDFNFSTATNGFTYDEATGYTVDINSTSLVNRTVNITDGPINGLGAIVFDETNVSTSTYVVGSQTVVILKGSQNNPDQNRSHRQYVDASVKTTISSKGAEDFVDATTEKGIPGQVVIDFDFSGDFITQNIGNTRAIITFAEQNSSNSADGTDFDDISVGIVGKPFSAVSTIDGASVNSNVITALIPANGRLSVELYGTSTATEDPANNPGTAFNTLYYISSITVNDFDVLATSRDDNELTKAIEVAVKGEDKNISVTMAAGGKKVATKVSIRSIGTVSKGSGTSNDKSISLPSAATSNLTPNTTSAFKTRSTVPVFTNIYYTLFDNDDNLRVLDAYGNAINMEAATLGDNYALTSSDKECAVVKMNSGSAAEPATIFFKDCAAGEEINISITVKGSLEENSAVNTITFTNIAKQSENTAFDVSLDVGSKTYNVANNDVVIKIVGDGHREVRNTTIAVTSDNKDAIIRIRPVALLEGSEFTSLVDNGTINGIIPAGGSYYVIRTDQKGKIAVNVSAVIPKDQTKAKKDKPIKGTLSYDVTLVDLVAPTASLKSTDTGFTITITDISLNDTLTTVTAQEDGKEVQKVTGSAGVYTASLANGVYAIKVYAIDGAGNEFSDSYAVVIGKSGNTVVATLESALIAHGAYDIAGTFTSYDFPDVDKAFDWVYTNSEGSYQLLGNKPTAKDVFGWKKVEMETPTSKDWYMVELTGDKKGPFGWILVNKTTKAAFKLVGAKATDKTLEFSGALYLNATISDSSVTFTTKK